MPKDRFFYPGNFSQGETLLIEGEEARHIRTVMRKSAGDSVELINGKGALAKVQLKAVDKESKKGLKCTVTHVETEKEPKVQTTLIQSIIRPQKLELVVEKACELGISRLIFLRSDRSDKSSPKNSRLEHIAISALKQSGRLHLPTFEEAPSLKEAIECVQGSQLLYGDIHGASFIEMQKELKSEPLAFVVGPEGGFSEKELEVLKESHAKAITLGPHILRSETASILGCGLMAAELTKS